MSETAKRPHTGRRRNDAAREAILDAAVRELVDGVQLTVDGIARAAGTGKQTVYRWWPSKGAVLLEALTARAVAQVPTPDTGTLRGDLGAFLTATFLAVRERETATLLRAVVAEAAHDPQVAAAVREFVAVRRAALAALLERGRARGELGADADVDLLVDQAYGVFWYRLINGHAPLNAEVADALAKTLSAR